MEQKIEDLVMNSNNGIPRTTSTADQFVDEPVATEKRINLILKEMEQGFCVDTRTLIDLKGTYESALYGLQKEIQRKLGGTLRVNSSRELANLLFHDFCLPPLRGTPNGSSSVSIDVLERLCDSNSDVYQAR